MIPVKLQKHDQYLDQLSTQLERSYDLLLRNVPLYSRKRRRIAEIDLVGFKDGYCDIFEVKCSYRIAKAKKQLQRIRRILAAQSRIRHAFFFCGEADMLVIV